MIGIPEAIIVASLILTCGMVVSAWILARHLSTRSATPVQGFPFLPAPPPLRLEAFPAEPSGIPIEPETRLEVGTAVLANWNETWWRAQVIGHEANGQVRIHYVGWDSSWDETKPRSQLQMDISGSVKD